MKRPAVTDDRAGADDLRRAPFAREIRVPPPHALYLRNMQHLWRFDPALADEIDAVADHHRVPTQPTRSGPPTASLPDSDGKPVALHSRYNPATEAARLIDATERLDEDFCFVVGGFGLGYHLLALRERIGEEAFIVVSEPNIQLLATAMATVDLTPLLRDGRTVIITRADKSQLHARLRAQTALLMMGTRFVPHPPSKRVAGPFHARFRELITDFIAYSRMSLMTLVHNSQITCHNIAYNLGRYATSMPIDALRDRFKNHPAIVVSAGPSLRRNIDQLAAVRDRAVICAVQTTLKPLMERGIKPHYVTSLDFHGISRQYFEGLDGLDAVHLVAEPKASWHVIDHYPGPISLLENAFARKLVGDALPPRGGLPAGATVAHLAFYLARYMGCNPIIFVGQDLAFTGHVFYVPGVEVHQTWRSEFNRFNTLETKEWERIARNGPVLRKVTGIDGAPVYSDELLFTYLEQFERDFAACDTDIINCTEGGARIRGTRTMPLHEALATFCAKTLPANAFDYLRNPEQPDAQRTGLPAVRRQLADRVDEIARLEDTCKSMLRLLRQLDQLTHDTARFNQKLIEVDQLRIRIRQLNHAFEIVDSAAQLAELRRFNADRRINAAQLNEIERAKRQLERDKSFVGELREACQRMNQVLGGARDRLDARIQSAACEART